MFDISLPTSSSRVAEIFTSRSYEHRTHHNLIHRRPFHLRQDQSPRWKHRHRNSGQATEQQNRQRGGKNRKDWKQNQKHRTAGVLLFYEEVELAPSARWVHKMGWTFSYSSFALRKQLFRRSDEETKVEGSLDWNQWREGWRWKIYTYKCLKNRPFLVEPKIRFQLLKITLTI